MVRYLGLRLAQWVPVLVVSSIVVFAIVHLLPGDPAVAIAGPEAPPEALEAIRRDLGLDRPLPVQYLSWLGDILRGDLGDSYVYGTPVSDLVLDRVPASLLLAAAALLLSVIIAIPLGVSGAIRANGPFDRAVSTITSMMIATPNFWFGIVLILLFSVHLGWFPAGGYVPLTQGPALALGFLALPMVAMALDGTAALTRFTRNALLDVLNEDYVRTSRAKGASEMRTVGLHALRNSAAPILTMGGITFGRTIGGAVVVESVFAWPGIGLLLVQAINSRDYTVIQGSLLVLVLLFLVINLVVDLLYGVFDPRIRVQQGAS